MTLSLIRDLERLKGEAKTNLNYFFFQKSTCNIKGKKLYLSEFYYFRFQIYIYI